MKYKKSVITIQKYCRGWLVRRGQINYVKKVVKVQCCIRRFLAKRELKKLKVIIHGEKFFFF